MTACDHNCQFTVNLADFDRKTSKNHHILTKFGPKNHQKLAKFGSHRAVSGNVLTSSDRSQIETVATLCANRQIQPYRAIKRAIKRLRHIEPLNGPDLGGFCPFSRTQGWVWVISNEVNWWFFCFNKTKLLKTTIKGLKTLKKYQKCHVSIRKPFSVPFS